MHAAPHLRILGLVFTGLLVSALFMGCPRPTVQTPDLKDMTAAQASATIIAAGLTVGTLSHQYSATIPVGAVISQEPQAGAVVAPNTDVDLSISKGPQPVSVPDVAGMAQAAAQTTIMEAGLTVGTVTQQYRATVPVGSVISQQPQAGAVVAPNTNVDLSISKGPQPVSVPDVAGMAQVAAQTTIMEAGLHVGTVSQQYSATVPVGSVISQQPQAGAVVAPNTTVDLSISKGPQPVSVPDVTEMDQVAAQSALIAAGLTLGTVSQQYDAAVPVGSVISQQPQAGAVVAPNTNVDLNISKGPQPVSVPDVAGMTQAGAQSAIIAAGLTLGTVSQQYDATAPMGSVISQDPEAEMVVMPGTAVDLVVSGPIQIVSIEELQRIGNETAYPLDAPYALTQDLDAAATATWNGGKGFLPIGSPKKQFTGVFDGQGHTISALTINLLPDNEMRVGLFTSVSGTIENLRLDSCSVSGFHDVGVLAGYCENTGTIKSCWATGTVTGSNNTGGLVGVNDGVIMQSGAGGTAYGYTSTGGLAGFNNGTLDRCCASNLIYGSHRAGGLTGESTGYILQSYATGQVIMISQWGDRTYDAGGLVAINSGTVEQCYATGDASGSANIGGLVGVNIGQVVDSYAHGAVTSGVWPGGLVGTNAGMVARCFATGTVSGNAAGGLIGNNQTSTHPDSYWDTQSSGQLSSSGGTGLLTQALMQEATFASWDFTDTWGILEDRTYPFLLALPTGNLTVLIEPVTAEAQWTIDDGDTWHDSGVTLLGLPGGAITVFFSTIPGWNAPQSQDITIEPGQTITLAATCAD